IDDPAASATRKKCNPPPGAVAGLKRTVTRARLGVICLSSRNSRHPVVNRAVRLRANSRHSPLAAGKQKCPERCRDLSLREKNRSAIRNQEGTPVKAPPSSQMGKAAWERSCRTCIAHGSYGAHHERDQRRWVRAVGGARDSAPGKLSNFQAP